MPKITIDNKEYEVPEGITLIQACELAEVQIPRFCYHERLEIAGNCRMCLVEVEGGPPKPVASCAVNVTEGMKVRTDSPMVKKAREGVMEFLLINHPLDCPICDQGGECDLQDQAFLYGKRESQYKEEKRCVTNKDIGPLVRTSMNRCIHCTRCVRFTTEVAGVSELGAIYRGEDMEITTYLEKSLSSELSANVIDLCPVGALTSKPLSFKTRSWELKHTQSIDIMDAVGSNIRLDSRGLEVMRILPMINEDINEEWISDKARFFYDGLKYQRLDKAYIRKEGNLHPIENDIAIKEFAKFIKKFAANEISALTGSLSSLDEIYALKLLMDKIGSLNTECRLDKEKLTSNSSEFLFNTKIANIEESDFCLLIGVNPRKDAAILNARIRKRFANNSNIYSLGFNNDLTYKHKYLGDNLQILIDILENDNSELAKSLSVAKKPMIIFGTDFISRKDGYHLLNLLKNISRKYNIVRDDWKGFNFLAKSSGLINGLFNDFILPNKEGIEDIYNKIANEQIKLVILHNVDDSVDFDKLKNSYVIYIGSHGDKGASNADLILPTKAFSEKDSLYINLNGDVQRAFKAVAGPENTIDDIEIFRQIAKELDFDLNYNDKEDLFDLLYQKIRTTKLEHEEITQLDKSKIDFATKIEVKDYDYYLTNQIARSSVILANCSKDKNNLS